MRHNTTKHNLQYQQNPTVVAWTTFGRTLRTTASTVRSTSEYSAAITCLLILLLQLLPVHIPVVAFNDRATHHRPFQCRIARPHHLHGWTSFHDPVSASDMLLAGRFATTGTVQDETPTSIEPPSQLVTFLLKVAYDGSRFSGWSAANDDSTAMTTSLGSEYAPPRRLGVVRSVEGVLRSNIAKIYGNIDPERIIIEACSRTDKGVHARGTVAQVYCLSPDALKHYRTDSSSSSSAIHLYPGQPSIQGKRLPHPWNATDPTECFTPVPVPLAKLSFALNRMCDDVKVMASAHTPPPPKITTTTRTLVETQDSYLHYRPFHPTLSAISKTYKYTFSVGPLHDPILYHRLWHIHGSWDMEEAIKACHILEGDHDFKAFRGLSRIREQKRKKLPPQDSICTLEHVVIHPMDVGSQPVAGMTTTTMTTSTTNTYVITITGNRFLYKMVRFLVGAIIATGQGKVSLEDLKNAFVTGQRPVFECAPAKGLVLHEVIFSEVIEWQPATS